MDRYLRPHYESSALLNIDTQRDTLEGRPLGYMGTSAVLPEIARLLMCFRGHSLPIIHIVRLYKPDGSNVDLCRRQRVEEGWRPLQPAGPGSELPPELLPHPEARLEPELLLAGGIQSIGPDEIAIYKPRWSAFYSTPLEDYLKSRAVTTLVVTGCNYPNCPRSSIYDASMRDYRIILVDDAVALFDERGRAEMEGIGVNVMNARAVVAEIERTFQRGGSN